MQDFLTDSMWDEKKKHPKLEALDKPLPFSLLQRTMKYVFLAAFAVNQSQFSKLSLSFLTIAQCMHFLKSKCI